MRPVDSSSGHHGGPAVRGQARAAEVHAAKAEGRSPSRAHWREAAATPAVEVSFSPEATTAAATAETATSAETAPTEAAPVATETAPAETVAEEATAVAAEAAADTTTAAAIVAEAIVASSIVQVEPGMYVDVVA